MLVSEQRLKDAGYRGKSLFTVEEEEEDSSQKIDDEVRAAPWNTTHHFINAMKGKYQLSITGPADPTGCGEGFSYTRLNTRRETGGGLAANKRYKPVVGTDGDLRKLKLSKAKQVLRNFGVPEEEISKLSRWAVIDMMEAQEKYKENCQRVFDLQNKVLSSGEQLSTDEESSDSGGEGGSDDELARNLETLLGGRKTARQFSHEQEELQRMDLRKLLDKPPGQMKTEETGEGSGRATPLDADETSSLKSFSSAAGAGRRLVIMRTFVSENGTEYTRTEVVKSQPVIDAYVRLMGHGGKEVRSQLVGQDQQTREDMKREKRRIQDQLRRLRRQEEKGVKKKTKTQKPKPLTTINMKCSACGGRGHMKTNKNCPMYKNTSVTVAPTDSDLAQQEASLTHDDLIKVEGTKVVLNRALVEHATGVRKASLLLKFPKDRMKRRRRQTEEDLEYLEKRPKSVQRRKANPELRLADLLERIINTISATHESEAFRKPVPAKVVPDYYNVIKFPMDLQTMKENCRNHVYMTREAFWEHMNLVVNNCSTYNGFKSELTRRAQKMLDMCAEEVKKYEKELEQLEVEINPALADDPQVALSYLFTKAVETMKSSPETWMFHDPVPAKNIPDYYKVIRCPMDLGTMTKASHTHTHCQQDLRSKCRQRMYRSRAAFMTDLNQIRENSLTYNGPRSKITATAETMVAMGTKALDEGAELISQLERKLEDIVGPNSPAASSSARADILSLCQGGSEGVGVGGGEEGEVDVEQWDEGDSRGVELEPWVEGVDLLLEDLQASSNSEDDSSDDED
ncbi:Transcription initiation factor TFIID subunit 1 [Geodia barretti]|uniref:Transcription initiation factor TFIID subunit 1 n=1 Tax=Geodia barretti TaxID=519541 RepID=A0AA35T697_GEOBA|nr:Transcription initiation factor TFIID subunit 1 [Geodia barretti]